MGLYDCHRHTPVFSFVFYLTTLSVQSIHGIHFLSHSDHFVTPTMSPFTFDQNETCVLLPPFLFPLGVFSTYKRHGPHISDLTIRRKLDARMTATIDHPDIV